MFLRQVTPPKATIVRTKTLDQHDFFIDNSMPSLFQKTPVLNKPYIPPILTQKGNRKTYLQSNSSWDKLLQKTPLEDKLVNSTRQVTSRKHLNSHLASKLQQGQVGSLLFGKRRQESVRSDVTLKMFDGIDSQREKPQNGFW